MRKIRSRDIKSTGSHTYKPALDPGLLASRIHSFPSWQPAYGQVRIHGMTIELLDPQG